MSIKVQIIAEIKDVAERLDPSESKPCKPGSAWRTGEALLEIQRLIKAYEAMCDNKPIW